MGGKTELSCQARRPGSAPKPVASFLGLYRFFLGGRVALEKSAHGGGHRRQAPLAMGQNCEGVMFGKEAYPQIWNLSLGDNPPGKMGQCGHRRARDSSAAIDSQLVTTGR